jgi:hypothetical protein
VPRHHLVPQVYLRHFADGRNRLHLVDRDDLTRTVPSTVNNALNETGFYQWHTGLGPEDVPDPAVLHPEYVESRLLSEFEGRAVSPLARILDTGRPPATAEDRYHLSHFIALQVTRGRRFRNGLGQARVQTMQRYLNTPEGLIKTRAWLADHGHPHEPADAQRHLARMFGPRGPRVSADPTHATQQALRVAFKGLAQRLLDGGWGVHRYETPALLTGDEPVTAWHPDGDPVTLTTTPVLWLPLNRFTLLAIHWPITAPDGRRHILRSDRPDADLVNSLTATQAERWIVHHPDDGALVARAGVGPRQGWMDDVLDGRPED